MVIFVKSVQRCVALANLLVEQNFPAIAIHRAMTQEERYNFRSAIKMFLLTYFLALDFRVTSSLKISRSVFLSQQICLVVAWILNE